MGLTNEDLEPPANDPEYVPDEAEPSTSKGEKRKSFAELGPEMKKLRMRPLQEHVKEWAEEEIEDVDDTIARLGMNHANAKGDKDKAKIYKQILDGQNPYQNQELTVAQAVALKVICSLSTFVQLFVYNILFHRYTHIRRTGLLIRFVKECRMALKFPAGTYINGETISNCYQFEKI